MQLPQLPQLSKLSKLTKNRRNAVITGVATFAVAGSATLALALPQDSSSAPAAAPKAVAAVGADETQQIAAAQAQANAQAEALTKAEADAKAKADAQAKADADAKAQAEAKAQADAQAQAQADAEAKARAAAQAQADAASRSEQRSTLSTGTGYSGTPQEIAAQIVPASQLQCFDNIVQHESSWNVTATNPSSGAYGLVQALPASKMAAAGADWRTNPATQIKWGLTYMNEVYGSPCGAWSFWQVHHAY
ncbi:transglycosylase SLT domain-containing protein [Kitasatospora sp. GP82]|uniref:aggregation-promoting factor C-terminal-like domain-containing protein n=1 Tax=Kitasatospora sp. GP82 TaxID=3035089 RepID=UPI002473FC44|nr:transglycosylase SLT domain-containing protein [Kitasatospora sp. GP82]MDH6125401.1 cytoskeletal protein RodZ [Kitasatospora sp. GP82]